MNIWLSIKEKLEKETGYHVISLPSGNQSIQANEIILSIEKVEKTGQENVYHVQGEIGIQAGHIQQWPIVTDLLDLSLTGTRAQARLVIYDHGFMAMMIGFDILIHDDQKRDFLIQEVQYDA